MGFNEIREALKDEVRQIRRQYPRLKDDLAFVLWFLRAYLADTEAAQYAFWHPSQHPACHRLLCLNHCDSNVDCIILLEKHRD